MSRVKEIKLASGKLGAMIQHDGYSDSLLLMTNGFQWSGSPINKDVARMAIGVLQDYIDCNLDQIGGSDEQSN